MFAPITFYARAQSWYSDVQSPMVKLGSDVDSNNVLKPSQWEGEGGNSYRRSVSDQSAACNAVATMAGTVGSTLTKCAIGGLVFYGAIIVVLIKMIAGVGAGTGATATGVGAPWACWLSLLHWHWLSEIGLLITAAVGLVTAEWQHSTS